MNSNKVLKRILVLLLITIISSVFIYTTNENLQGVLLFVPPIFMLLSIAIYNLKYFYRVMALIALSLVLFFIWLADRSLALLSAAILVILAILLINTILGVVIKNKKKRILILVLVIIGVPGSYYYYQNIYYPQVAYKAVFEQYCRKSDILGTTGEAYFCGTENENMDPADMGKIQAYCNASGFNFTKVGGWSTVRVCIKTYDQGKICTDGDQCSTGYCISKDSECENNCVGSCDGGVYGNYDYKANHDCISYENLANGRVILESPSGRCIPE